MAVSRTPSLVQTPLDSRDASRTDIRLGAISVNENSTKDLTRSAQDDAESIRASPMSDGWDTKEGWVVVAAGAAIFFVYLGLTYSYGIVQLHLAEEHLASVSTLSFIGSVGAAMSPMFSMITSRIITRIGYRRTAGIGGFLLALGVFTAGFATKSVPGMFLTQGFLYGAGAALLFLPAATVPSLWFKRKRGLATGVVFCGAGIGSAVIALTMEKLISAVGLPSALKILGGCAWLVLLPAAYFLKAPAGRERAVVPIPWGMIKTLKFIIMFIMGGLAVFPLFVPPFMLPLYVVSLGQSSQTGAIILASWNLASAVGRIGMGFGADSVFGPVNSMFLSLCIVGVTSLALWPFASSLGLIIFFAILNGAGSGGFFSLTPVVTAAIFGDRDLPTVMSMLNIGFTFGYFMGAPIAGYLLEAYGGTERGIEAFRPAFFYAGSLTLASAGLILAIRFMINKKILARV